MPIEDHERARFLLDRAPVEAISPEERHWLDLHLSRCAECGAYAELSQRAICALGRFAFEIDRDAALRVEQAVQAYASRTKPPSPVERNIRIGVAAVFFLTLAGSLAMWQIAGWLAGRIGLPTQALHAAVIALWLLPSLTLDLVLLFRSNEIAGRSGGEEGEML